MDTVRYEVIGDPNVTGGSREEDADNSGSREPGHIEADSNPDSNPATDELRAGLSEEARALFDRLDVIRENREALQREIDERIIRENNERNLRIEN